MISSLLEDDSRDINGQNGNLCLYARLLFDPSNPTFDSDLSLHHNHLRLDVFVLLDCICQLSYHFSSTWVVEVWMPSGQAT